MTWAKRASAAALVTLMLASSAFGQATAPAPASTQRAPQPAQIDRNGVLILVRTTLLAVHDANVTGNYTVLRDLGAPGFQAGNTAARLSELFANLRTQNVDLSGVAAVDPRLTILPQIEASGMMTVSA